MNDNFLNKLQQQQQKNWVKGVSAEQIIAWLHDFLGLLFPEKTLEMINLQTRWQSSQQRFATLLQDAQVYKNIKPETAANELYEALPAVYEALQADAVALLNNDPAASNISEILNSHPGFFAVTTYRIAHAIAILSIPHIPRILSEHAHSHTGIDIHPAASIDVPFVIDHGTGIVIGATTIIGRSVQLYQGVTLGALWVEKKLELTKRHPTIEHNVVIYANATILGGSTVIGNNSIIGGNTFITKSVNPYSVVQQSGKNITISRELTAENNSFTI